MSNKSVRSISRRFILACLAGGMLASPFVAHAKDAQPLNPPVDVKIGTFRSLSDGTAAIAASQGYFKKQGLNVEFVPFANSGEAMQALGLGQIDALSGPVNAGLFNVIIRKIPLKIVATAGNQPPGSGTIALVLREDLVASGRYQKPADLKGLKLSVPGRTSAAHFFLKELAEQGGLSLADLNIAHLGLPEGVPAMVNKSLDGVATVEPYVTMTVEEVPGRKVVGMDEVLPGFPVSYLLYSPDFTKRSPEAAKRFMVAYIQGGRDYRAAFSAEKVDQSAVLGMLQQQGIAATAASVPPNIDFDGEPSFAGVDDFADWLLEEGVIKQKIDLRDSVDDSYRQEAIQALQQSQ
ncbi:MAG: ABC transporter substrate-binding protein [Pigmentiphaga sp.]|nr:ABC transporter substrate-binding protein [Pigmentiphaga sp.]